MTAKRYRDSREMEGMVRRVSRGMVKRAADGDFEALQALVAMRDHIDAAIGESARALYAYEDISWTAIGQELGMTRQAARQRFADNKRLSRKEA